MSRRNTEGPQGDDPVAHGSEPPEHRPLSLTDLPAPWDATPGPPQPDVLESGAAAPKSIGAAAPKSFGAAAPARKRRRLRLPRVERPAWAHLTDPEPAGPDAAGAGAGTGGAGGVREAWTRAVAGSGRFGRRAMAAALVVGLVLGGLLVHGYEHRLAEQATRDRIALAARVVPLDTAGGEGRDTWMLRLVVANRGASDLRLRAAALAETPLRSSLRTVSTGVTLPAGRETWISMDVSGACADGGLTRAPTALDVVLTRDDRPEQRARIALADDTSLLLSSARQTCMDSNFALWAAAEQVSTAHLDKNGLFIPVRFRSNWSPAWEVTAVRNAGTGLAATVSATLPIRFTSGITPVTTVRWTITDCVQAKALGYTGLRLRTTLTLPRATRSIEVTTTLSGALTEAVSTFVRRACP